MAEVLSRRAAVHHRGTHEICSYISVFRFQADHNFGAKFSECDKFSETSNNKWDFLEVSYINCAVPF